MAYPPPPGLKASGPTPAPPSSLPARPAAPLPSFKPAASASSSFAAFTPRQLGAVVSAAPAPPASFAAPAYQAGPSQPHAYPQPAPEYGASATPHIRNPFPLPGQDGGRFPEIDPEMEAQIAQWQTAYSGNDGGKTFSRAANYHAEGAGSASGANAGPVGGRNDIRSAADGDSGVAAVVHGPDGKQKTVVRSGGGQTWTDPSLLEWDPAHFRLFVGNLAGEVTDDSLLKAFNKFPSVQKARVVRDKRSTKSKGYGFVSFSDGDEYFRAARDMQGKYIGSHPVLLRRSTTEIRPVAPKDNKRGKGKYGKGTGGGGGNAKTGGGVQKKANKTKGGLRVLG